ncbi:MAG: ABC transporter ATP-binding protein [Deltaproteobacteria bacterium]|nr:ABC transporter ATP-binding protein [Deltaproteobacteria bacterium]
MIQIEDLHKSFDGHRVLNGVSIEIEKGQVLALIGASGCGKSVLLKHVAGLMTPDRGRVLIDGQDIWAGRGKPLRALRERLGFLFQGGALFDSMSVFENVAFPLKEKTRLSDQTIRSRVFEELEQVGLAGSENKYPSQISGGMVKRAALARALIRDPEMMFFDEPTTGLDPVIGRTILNLIDACHKKFSFTGIIVTHEIPQVFDIVDRVAMLHEGHVRAEGTPHALTMSADEVVQAFVGEPAREVKK